MVCSTVPWKGMHLIPERAKDYPRRERNQLVCTGGKIRKDVGEAEESKARSPARPPGIPTLGEGGGEEAGVQLHSGAPSITLTPDTMLTRQHLRKPRAKPVLGRGMGGTLGMPLGSQDWTGGMRTLSLESQTCDWVFTVPPTATLRGHPQPLIPAKRRLY